MRQPIEEQEGMNDSFSVPEGLEFLNLVWKQEDECESQTDCRIPNLGEKAPRCLEGIGTTLSLLDRMSSCWWGCGGGRHQIEYLCGRVASNGRAALRLLKFGFYDESLALCRNMGENANLLNLLALDSEALTDWKASQEGFRPVEVRRQIEAIQGKVLIDRYRYQTLSSVAVHANPTTIPQTYNPIRLPVVGAQAQDEGIMLCLNELALPLAVSAAFGARLINLEPEIKERIKSSAVDLLRRAGAITIDNRPPSIFDELVSEANQA